MGVTGQDSAGKTIETRRLWQAMMLPLRLGQDTVSGTLELLRTNGISLISRIKAHFDEAGIDLFVADRFTSAIKGSTGAFPRRSMVPADTLRQARRVLIAAGPGAWIHDEA